MPSHRKPKRITGVCIAGSPAEPRVWYRSLGVDGFVEFHGRQNMNAGAVTAGQPKRQFYCDLRQKDPIETCRPCVAYRNAAQGHTGLAPDGDTILSLTSAEYELLLDDIDAFYRKKEEGWSAISTLARKAILTEDLPDEAAEYRRDTMRRWRAAHPGADKRKRNRAEYMRQYRKRNPIGPDMLARE